MDMVGIDWDDRDVLSRLLVAAFSSEATLRISPAGDVYLHTSPMPDALPSARNLPVT